MRDKQPKLRNISRVTVSVPLGMVLSGKDIEQVIANTSNLAMNQNQIPADCIELLVVEDPSSAGNEGVQQKLDAAAADLDKSSTALQTEIEKETKK